VAYERDWQWTVMDTVLNVLSSSEDRQAVLLVKRLPVC
jgi:hypothetical protein